VPELKPSKSDVLERALALGFCKIRLLTPTPLDGARALLVVALSYGNDPVLQGTIPLETNTPSQNVWIADFARKNYYAEAVYRLKRLARQLREEFGGNKAEFRIICNSPIPEKPLAAACGLGAVGRNSLIITKEAGSLVVLAAMTLPFELETDSPIQGDFPFCSACGDPAKVPCVRACPSSALRGDGRLIKERCIQWYASGNRMDGKPEVPAFVAEHWGQRLYGCTDCQDACPHNKRPLAGALTERGALEASYDAPTLLEMSEVDLTALFKGSALGMSWLGPKVLKENIRLSIQWMKNQ